MAMPDEHVALTQEAFDKLPEYSCSNPTATTIGKQWKGHYPDGWWMYEYVKHPTDPKFVRITARRIVIRQAGLKASEVVGHDEAMELWLKQKEMADGPQ